jgi:hypothetical protein
VLFASLLNTAVDAARPRSGEFYSFAAQLVGGSPVLGAGAAAAAGSGVAAVDSSANFTADGTLLKRTLVRVQPALPRAPDGTDGAKPQHPAATPVPARAPMHVHFFDSDYTVHHRPGFSVRARQCYHGFFFVRATQYYHGFLFVCAT